MQFLFDDIASAFARNNHDFEAPTDLLSKNDFSDLMPFSNQNDESPSSCTEDKLFLSISALGEYFNSLRKCWEPLCEKIKAEACYELVSKYLNLFFNCMILDVISPHREVKAFLLEVKMQYI